MKYNGIVVKEFTSDKPLVFDPPKNMVCWDHDDDIPRLDIVDAYIPKHDFPVKCSDAEWRHCAEIQEELKPRRATNLELAKWLANGNGLVAGNDSIGVWTTHTYTKNEEHNACDKSTVVRKWRDAEWHEPTEDYMGLDD